MEGGKVQACHGANKQKKMKVLCLHGFRASGSFLKKQISRWDSSILSHFDMDFPDGLFPAGGKSDIEGFFPPPYFEWFQFNPDFTEYTNLDKCITHLCDYITKNGPFDGLLGFSQGATISGLLLGYHAQGKILKDHPPFKVFVSVSGTKFRDPEICNIANKELIKVRSIHFIGAKDHLKIPSEEFVTAFVDPLIIRHSSGHIVPRLDEATTAEISSWVEKLVAEVSGSDDCDGGREVKKEIGEAAACGAEGQVEIKLQKEGIEAVIA